MHLSLNSTQTSLKLFRSPFSMFKHIECKLHLPDEKSILEDSGGTAWECSAVKPFPLREICVFFSVPLLLLLLASILHSKCVQHVSNGKSVNACVWRIWNGPWSQVLLWSGAIADWQPMLNINQKSAFTAVNHCDLGVLCSSSIAELRNTEVLEPFLLANLLKKNNNCTLGIMGK